MRGWQLLLGVAVLVSGLSSTSAHAQGYATRQYYGSWQPYNQYYYRSYYFKPFPSYSGYRHHYCVYVPSQPKYVYFYNPYKKQYWGRCTLERNGESLYSQLPPNVRRPQLAQIPERAFPPPSPAPAIPESSDGAKLDLPPDDAPPPPPAGPPGTPIPTNQTPPDQPAPGNQPAPNDQPNLNGPPAAP